MDFKLAMQIAAENRQAVEALKQTGAEVKAVGAAAQATSAEGARLAAELAKVGTAAGTSATRLQEQINKTTGVNAANAEASRSAAAWAAQLNKEAAAFDQLKGSLFPAIAAEQQFAAVQAQVNAAVRSGIADQTEANAVLDQARLRFMGVTPALDGVQKGTFAAGGGMRMFGQQLSQVAQQGAVTGNYLGALAVQLPDMALGFGSVAIAASIVATVALPLIIGAFGGGKTAAEEMADANSRLGESISALRTIGETDLEGLRKEYGKVDAELLKLLEHQREFQINAAQNAARDAVAALAQEYGVAAGNLNLYRITGKGMVADLAAELGLSKDAMLGFQAALREAQTATTFEDQARALAKVEDYLHRSTLSGSEMAGEVATAALELRKVEAAAAESADGAERLTANLSTAGGAAQGVAGWSEMANANIAAAANQAARLAGNLLEAMSLRNRVAAQENSGGRGDGWEEMQRRQNPTVNPDAGAFIYTGPALDVSNNPRSSAGAGGGGGGRSGPTAGSLEALQAEARKAMEVMGLSVAGINEKVQAGLMSTAEGVSAVSSAKDRTANALADLIPKIAAIGGPQSLAAVGNLRSALKDLVGDIGKAGTGLGASLTKSFEGAFASFLSGAKSGKDAFQAFTQSVLSNIANIMAQRFSDRFVAPLIGGIMGMFGLARGGVVEGGAIQAFADGGVPALESHRNKVVSGPTLFALGGGKTGLMGEAGPEAVMPLRRGPEGLSVVASGPGGETLLPLARGVSGALGVRLSGDRSAAGRSPMMDRAPVAFAVGGVVGGGSFTLGEQAGDEGSNGALAARAGRARQGETSLQVVVEITNQGPPVTARQTGQRSDGGKHIIEMLIEQTKGATMNDIARGGDLAGVMEATYGLQRRGQ